MKPDLRAQHTPQDARVFVFGSNLKGIHGAGAARYAWRQLGALPGVGDGPTGRAYALPTCSSPGVPLLLGAVAHHVDRFLAYATYAKKHGVRFYVSAVGCGLAGFTAEQIAPLFLTAPDNCDLPDGWRS